MLKATKVRIYPTDEQVIQLSKDFGATRWLWNQSLALMSQAYKETGKGVSAYDMKKRIPGLKKEHEWLKETYSQCLQLIDNGSTKPESSSNGTCVGIDLGLILLSLQMAQSFVIPSI